MWLLVAFIIALNIIPGLHFSDTNTLNVNDHLQLCVAKILSCDYYRQSFTLYEEDIGIFSNIEDLKKACKQQVPYMRCIARAEKFCEEIMSPIAKEMIKSRRFATDICRPPSPWQQVYLREARCLNTYSRLAFVLCIDKKIGISNLDQVNSLELGCKYGKAIIECSATTVQEKCGYYAGYILKNFLKFHSLSDYKCIGFKVDDVEDNSLSSAPNYDIIEAIFKILEQISHDELTEGTDTMKNTNFVKIEVDIPKNVVLDHPLTESTTVFDVNYLVPEEFLSKTEDSLSDSSGLEGESKDVKPDEYDFPILPKHQYIHKNRTTFALYEDLAMGHTKYIGCGEADIFWVEVSPLRSKYCTLVDLNSEYSESIFKCTIHIDAPCSPELDGEDLNKNAEVFHLRYVVTVLTPTNNQRLEDMAVMNVHYLKLYPFPSMHVPEEKTNLWTDQANKVPFEEIESVNRRGPFEKEDDYNTILYRHSNGSGQKKDADKMKHPHYLDADEYYEEYENWDYYPLDRDDDIYFPKLLTNDVIYIENDNGDLISLHDQLSPIYSKSLYQPHSLFRPRIGAISAASNALDDRTNRNKKLVQSSSFEERISKFKDKTPFSKTNPNQQGHCSAEAPCPPNLETIFEFGIKPGMHINLQNIKTFDPFKGLNKKLPHPIQSHSGFKLDSGIDEESYLCSRNGYVVTPSTKIELPKSTASTRPKKPYINEFVTDPSRYPFEEEHWGDIKDITDHSNYLGPDCSTTVRNAQGSANSKIDYLESFGEYYAQEFTQGPYDYLSKYPEAKGNLKSTIDLIDLEVESLLNESEWKDLLKIIRKFLVVLGQIL